MSQILQTNIFLFITSAAIILFVAVLIILVIYLISVVRDVKKISSRAKEEVSAIADDLDAARDGIKNESKKILSIFSLFSRSSKTKKKKK